jgi:hypothetical protein
MSQARSTAAPAPAVAYAGGLHAVAPPSSPAEREADRFADSFVAADGGPGWSFGDVPVHAGDGARLAPTLEARLGAELGADLTEVRLHDGPEAADLTTRAGAEAVAIGQDISFAPGKRQPNTRDGVRRVAHEVAHTVKHSDKGMAHRQGNAPVTPATTLAGLSEADRKRIQVVTTTAIKAPTNDELKNKYFAKGTTLPVAAPVSVDQSVPAALTKGLTNIAGDLSSGTSPSLGANTTVELELDLTTHGGTKAPCRFTYTEPPAAKGQTAQGRILVEQLGAAKPPPGATKPADPKPGEKVPADPIADKLKAASITYSGYKPAEEQALRAAIALVPSAHLSLISGLTFIRKSTNPGDASVAGKYFPAADTTQGVSKANTIVIFDKAFEASSVVNVEGGVATSMASREILHEIGHAVDLRPLQKANEDVDAALSDVNAAASPKFADKAEADRFKAAEKAHADAKKKLKDFRTASGTQTVEKKSVATDVIGAATTDFRDAVKKDGKKVSKYAEKDWQDSFAEAYSLYLSSPSDLLLLRPATHAYFLKAYPK